MIIGKNTHCWNVAGRRRLGRHTHKRRLPESILRQLLAEWLSKKKVPAVGLIPVRQKRL